MKCALCDEQKKVLQVASSFGFLLKLLSVSVLHLYFVLNEMIWVRTYRVFTIVHMVGVFAIVCDGGGGGVFAIVRDGGGGSLLLCVMGGGGSLLLCVMGGSLLLCVVGGGGLCYCA